MEFTYRFISLFTEVVILASPLLLSLLIWIISLGLIVGRREGWCSADTVYWSMVTATTLGYGDLVPEKGLSRFLAVLITLGGVIFTGILVAIAVQAAGASIDPGLLNQLKRTEYAL